jgi:hypothetical protein
LQKSLVLVHGGMAQDVGPILEMVTEKYLLRSPEEWHARQKAIGVLHEVLRCLQAGDVRGLGQATEKNFFGPIQSIIPWASNAYTETLIERVRSEFQTGFWGFWMLGGMAGGGMGFIFSPAGKTRAQDRLLAILHETKRELEDGSPFAMNPVVYDFQINERGTVAQLLDGNSSLMPEHYYALVVPSLLRMDQRLMPPSRRKELDRLGAASRAQSRYAGIVQDLFDRLLPSADGAAFTESKTLGELLNEYGFDAFEHERTKCGLQNGSLGLAQNRLPPAVKIEDALAGDVFDSRGEMDGKYRRLGTAALRNGQVAVVSLAGGAGTRWTRGAGAVKALNPFRKFDGKFRTFVEVHLAKSRKTSRQAGMPVPHVITTSYLTHAPIERHMTRLKNYGYEGILALSPGCSIGLRLVPMVGDLRFAWEEMPQQELDEQKGKVRESLRLALIQWALQGPEGADYTDNLPLQCLHPTGHWYEVPNMMRNGVLLRLLEERPQLEYLMMHNIDTVGANLDAGLLGFHIDRDAAMTVEVVARQVEDHGGGLARVNGRLRLVEGLALPSEKIEAGLSYYNTNTFWISIDKLLRLFGLSRANLHDAGKTAEAVRRLAGRMPSYITLKDVKKRWGKGQEDVFPVAQFEKLFVDMTALDEIECAYAVVARKRGQQLKEPAQLDGWLREGSAEYVAGLGEWD